MASGSGDRVPGEAAPGGQGRAAGADEMRPAAQAGTAQAGAVAGEQANAAQTAQRRSLLIVWWSMTGGTEQLAAAAAEGARSAAAEAGAGGAEVEVRLLRADHAGPQQVLEASGYLFCTPENLATMAGMLKDFFDRSYYAALDRINGRPYGSIVCAGSDGQGAARQIDRIATGWRLRQAAPPLIVCTHAQTPEAILAPKHIGAEDLARARELGEGLAAGVAMGVW